MCSSDLIEAQATAHTAAAEDDAFVQVIKTAATQTGIVLVDAWNGVIRPLLATISILLWIASLHQRNYVHDEWDRALISLALGVFVGGRIHATGR